MVSRLLLSYAVVELAVVFALAATIGFGWTLLVLLATFVLGFGLLRRSVAGSSADGSCGCDPAWRNHEAH